MSQSFELPELGEEIERADVVGVLVAPGDEVRENQSVIEVQTDKATVEIPAPASGRVVEVLVAEGDTVEVGQDFLRMELGPDGSRETEEGDGAERGEASTAQAPGARADGQPASSEEADEEHGEEEPEDEPEHEPRPRGATGRDGRRDARRLARGADESPGPPAAAPSVRRFAREIGVDVERVPSPRPGARISIADVKDYARRARELRAADTGSGARLPDEEDVAWRTPGPVRRATARRMREAWATIPHVTLHAGADVTALGRALAAHEGGRGLTAVLLKVLALALRAVPEANAALAEQGERIVQRRYVHLGVAVDTDHGLLVPVLRDCDRKGVEELTEELREAARRARAARLRPDDMRGGCATLTNLGAFGIESFTPIIVPGQAVILGVGRMAPVPTWVDERVERRERLPLSLSFDHRLLDGADGARLLGWIVRALEDPWFVLLGPQRRDGSG